MTDSDGDLVQHYGYYPFGNERYIANGYAFSVSNRYTGQILDEDTGLYYYVARYYDAQIGRFIQADPIVPVPDTANQKIRTHPCHLSFVALAKKESAV
ncbi:MAG: RHS repeat-associated core domain-containing protein [Phycisphaerae bacterium]|jgi:RHS repeat-associated protein